MMDITVKTLDGQNRSFSVPENITVKQFKEKIANSINIPADTQRLIFQGKVLQDEKLLREYDVHGKVVHVVVRAPPGAGRPAGNDSPAPSATPGMGHRDVNNIVVGSFTLPSDILDPNSVQRIAQDAISAMGDMGRNARVSTRVSNDGSAVDVHIHLGQVPSGQVESEAQMRLNQARRMIRLANETLNQLENPQATSSEGSPASNTATNSQSTDQSTDNQRTGSPMETDTETPSTSKTEDEKKETSQSEDTEMRSPNEESRTETQSANENQSTSSQSEASSSEQQSTATSGPQPPRGPVRPNITALGEVLEEIEELNRRLQPHLQRFTQIVRDDAESGETEVIEQQRVCNMVSEVMHSISHSYHAVSDLMVDLSQPRPRQLYVTLAIAQPHAAVIQQTIPVQAQIVVGGSPRMLRRHQARHPTPASQLRTDNAMPRPSAPPTMPSSQPTPAPSSTAATSTTSTTQSSGPPPQAAHRTLEGEIEAEIQAALRQGLETAGMEGRGIGSPSNPYVFVEMGPDTISVNSISAQVVSTSEETGTSSTSTGTTPSSTSTTQAQSIPPDFLQGFVESIMQSAGQAAFGGGGGGQPQAMHINIGQGQPGNIRMMGQGPPGNFTMMGQGLPGNITMMGQGHPGNITMMGQGPPNIQQMMGFPNIGRGFQVRPTVISNRPGFPRNESGTQTVTGSGIPTNSGTQTSAAQTSTFGTQTSQAPASNASNPTRPTPSSTSGTQTPAGVPRTAALVVPNVSPVDPYLSCSSRHFLTRQARSVANQAASQNSETMLADMVNNLMSGLLGQGGNQPSAPGASTASSTGTSTTSTATSAGTSQPGPANSTQPGMAGVPRANIRIENAGGLSGLFPGRMPQIPGMRFRMNVPHGGIRIQTQMPRPGPVPPGPRPGQSSGAQPTPQPSWTAPGGPTPGGTEPPFLQMLRTMLQSGSQNPQPSGSQQTPTTAASTAASPATSTTTTDQNQNIRPSGQPPLTDEAFTRLVGGISSYMSQAALGQAPQQSITDFLSNLGETYNIPQEEGFINDILSCILSQLQITDIIQVFYGSPAPLNRVREPLRQFVRTRVLEDAPPTIENIRQSVVRLIDSMQADIQDTVNTSNPREPVDFLATLNVFLTQHFNNMIRFIMNAEEATDTFGRDLYQCFRRFLAELIILCSRCLGGLQEVERLVDHRIRNMTGGVNPVIQQWMAGMTSQQLSQFIPTITVSEGEISHYVINRNTQAVAEALEASCKEAAESKKKPSRETEKSQQSSSREPVQKRPASPQQAKEKVEPALPMETSTPNSSPGASEMEIDSNKNNDASLGALPAGSAAKPKSSTEQHLSPTGAQAETGDWQSVVPPDWVPVITRDIETQKSQKSQQPHSDAYLQGMPPKRRKLMTQNRPGDISNSSDALSTSLRRAVATAAVEPISSLENLTNEVSDNTELQAAFQEQVSSVVTHRLETDTDYKAEKFPNTEDYYKKKRKGETDSASGANS